MLILNVKYHQQYLKIVVW